MTDFCAGTWPTAKACLLLDQHRKIVRRNLDSDALSAAEPVFLLIRALQVWNPNCNTTGDEEMRAVAGRLKKKVTVALARRKPTAWKLTPGLDATQMRSEHNLHFRPTLYENYGLYEKCRNTPLRMWPLVWKCLLDSTDPKVLLARHVTSKPKTTPLRMSSLVWSCQLRMPLPNQRPLRYACGLWFGSGCCIRRTRRSC